MTKTDSPLEVTARRFVVFIGKPAFFRIILGLFIVEAGWIALTGRYPMAFDEGFHLGIIRLYAHHLSPFWSSQPPGADTLGAVARDPSYLYQYLMSFPYRLITLFTHDQTIQVLLLRAIDIALFAWGISLYRRLLFKTGYSRPLIHGCLLIFTLVPVVPLLAAQINYDDMVLPVTALVLLLAVRLDRRLIARKQLDAKTLLQLLILCLLGSLVKYAFLPIFAAIALFVIVRCWQRRRHLRGGWLGFSATWRQLGRRTRAGLVVALVIATGLFGQRYVVNLVRYHALVPVCNQVLSVSHCSKYGPWNRNYTDKLAKPADAPRSPVAFASDWFYGMWLRLFFAVDGPATGFQTRGPLLLPGLAGIAFAAAGLVAVLAALPRLFKGRSRSVMALFVLVSLVYAVALWLDDYRAFLATGQPVAINGRYLIPILLPAFLVVAAAAHELLKRRQTLKAVIACVAIVCTVWGGGALTYILRSNDAWYWPSPVVRTVNHAVQRTLGPITPGYHNPVQFLH